MSEPIGDPTNAIGDGVAIPDRKTAVRWTESTRYFEAKARGGSPEQSSGIRDGMRWITKAKVGGTAIAVATAASTPTGGTATLCDLVSGVWTTNGVSVTIYNPSPTGTVAANSYVTVAWVGGIWEIVIDPC
jgi:hypothetical protein